jgi:hypothetical protein
VTLSLHSGSQQQQQQQQKQQQGPPLLEVNFCFYPAPGLVGVRCARGGADAGGLASALFPDDKGDGEVGLFSSIRLPELFFARLVGCVLCKRVAPQLSL